MKVQGYRGGKGRSYEFGRTGLNGGKGKRAYD